MLIIYEIEIIFFICIVKLFRNSECHKDRTAKTS